ncbi:thermonuclease family protein [Sphingobium chungbukense]|uniref:Nuclease n=1 Tax=Sphingobium chungbukense TaxID=56193 RepID=A0A0M3AU75_9SPHN|nr:thermonuclease family protein [Sphingobium chungbukense]KKW92496.1 nuclease [Sphingobium chungbukense]
MTGLIRNLSCALALAALTAAAPPTTGKVAWVIDGDTVRLTSGERIRIADIDAAETRKDQAKCAAEIETGKAATRNAIDLLKGRTISIVRVGRSYNRTVARISLGDRDVGTMLIAKGVARPWLRHQPKPDWCSA